MGLTEHAIGYRFRFDLPGNLSDVTSLSKTCTATANWQIVIGEAGQQTEAVKGKRRQASKQASNDRQTGPRLWRQRRQTGCNDR